MRRIAFLSIALLLTAGSASAATLHSAPALAGFADAYLECFAQNVSTSPRTVTLEILDFSGAVVLGPTTTTLAPNELEFLIANSTPSAASCRVTLDGSARNVRAQVSYFNPTTNRFTASLPVE